jgi:hypothetical protein
VLKRLSQILCVLAGTCAFTSACDYRASRVAPASAATREPQTEPKNGQPSTSTQSNSLTIRGFNYTDTYISNFTVNGVGGGNLEVSDRQAGGGGGTCCAPISSDVRLPFSLEIEWRRDGSAPYCRQNVLLYGPVPAKPYALDVHFYQDGTIQVAVSEFEAGARVTLDRFNYVQRKETGNTNNDAKFSRCGP